MAQGCEGPLMCIGDFNDIVSDIEKEAGRRKEKRKRNCFQELISSCLLNDVHYQGQKFTWFGIREGELIKERLDRVLANLEWLEEFPNMQVINLPAVGSDHSPIIMNSDCRDKRAAKSFRYEANWLTMVECEQIIKEGWSIMYGGSRVNRMVRKLCFCKTMLME